MENCIFCQIVKKEKKAKIIYEDDLTIGFYDINPQSPVHILVIPKKHIVDLIEIKEEDKEILSHIFLVIKKISRELGIKSFRVVTNTGRDSGQSVFHLHFHLLSGRKMGWPPG